MSLRRLKRMKRRAALARVPKVEIQLPTEELARRAVEFAASADAANTSRAYASQWRKFEAWCLLRRVQPLPAASGAVALYLTERASQGAKLPTMEQALAAIRRRHEDQELPVPAGRDLRTVWKGIRRKVGAAAKKASPIGPEDLRRMVKACPGPEMACLRDAALVLVGFAGSFRRAELVAFDVEDLTFTDDGLVAHVKKSKTDQEAKGEDVGVPYGSDRLSCPVRSLRAWFEASGIKSGAVFVGVGKSGRLTGKRLHGRDVARVLQRAAARAGVSVERLSGHSLRTGLGTTAAKQGKRLEVIQKHMRHKKMDQTVEYLRSAKMFDEDENAASGIGL